MKPRTLKLVDDLFYALNHSCLFHIGNRLVKLFQTLLWICSASYVAWAFYHKASVFRVLEWPASILLITSPNTTHCSGPCYTGTLFSKRISDVVNTKFPTATPTVISINLKEIKILQLGQNYCLYWICSYNTKTF